MDKLIQFGKRAMFYVRVLSGYEERRIRNYRLQLDQRLLQAQAKREALKKIPEQALLGEIRRVVEDMQTLNKKLEETEAAIDEYFKPFDKHAETIMKVQLEGEERRTSDMVRAMREQALLQQADMMKNGKEHHTDTKKSG